MKQRKDICLKLIDKPHDYDFIRQTVTTDEKWIYFRNHDKFGQWIDRGSRVEPHDKRGQFKKRLCHLFFGITKVSYSLIYSHMVKQLILNTIVIYSNGYMQL